MVHWNAMRGRLAFRAVPVVVSSHLAIPSWESCCAIPLAIRKIYQQQQSTLRAACAAVHTLGVENDWLPPPGFLILRSDMC